MNETSKPAIILDFLRHGEAQGGHYYRGVTDDPLTELGWRQMYGQCSGGQWDAVISSPLRRCRSFASAWCQQQQRTLRIDPAWMEIDFGDWEGQTADQISAQDPDALAQFYADPVGYTPPNAESYSAFSERVAQGLEDVLANHAGQNVLIVTHGGVIRALFSLILGIPVAQSWQIDVPHACLTRFSCFHDPGGRFMQLNFHKAG
ncbi:MAG: alpha-ribazole phosphatase family protein [Methylococcaceae bacterium]|nr:alpha-ribazole phosphatase family protein [Methylococcaceae bacterium]